MKESQFQDMKKLYPHEFTAKKLWICYGCNGTIHRGDKYHKVRVDAHMWYSKATRLKPLCIDCCEQAILKNPKLLESEQ